MGRRSGDALTTGPVTGRRWSRAGAGPGSGARCRSSRACSRTAPPPRRRRAGLLRARALIDVLRRDVPRRLVELDAQPAHDGRGVGELAALDQFPHAGVAAGALLDLARSVGAPRQVHVKAALLAANTTGSHEEAPYPGR